MIKKLFLIILLCSAFSLSYAGAPLENAFIAIDPGHSDLFPGTRGHDLEEEDLTFKYSARLLGEVVKFGAKPEFVYMTRKSGHPTTNPKNGRLPLNPWQDMKFRNQRINNEYKKYLDYTFENGISPEGLLVSVHFNGVDDSTINGAEVYRPRYSQLDFALDVENELLKIGLDKHDVPSGDGVKERNYNILIGANPRGENQDFNWLYPKNCILVEPGFITNQGDADKLKNDEWKKKIVRAYLIGILRHLDKISTYTIQAESEDNEFQGTVTEDGWVRIDEEEKPVFIA